MTKVTPALVKELRQRSGVGILDCQKALEAMQGDINAAFDMLRKSGQARADEKAGRATIEGLIAIKLSQDNQLAVILEINCETDFVSRDTHFKAFVEKVIACALAGEIDNILALSNQLCGENNETVEQARQILVGQVGENVQLTRLHLMKAEGEISYYLHHSRIGVLVDLKGGDAGLSKDIAMHIAANRPTAIAPEDIPKLLLAKEKEIIVAQVKDTDKPPAILEKIIDNKMNKFIDNATLLGQPFLRDSKQQVGTRLKDAGASVHAFVRFEVGEALPLRVVAT